MENNWSLKYNSNVTENTTLSNIIRRSILETRKCGLLSKLLVSYISSLSNETVVEFTLNSSLDFEIVENITNDVWNKSSTLSPTTSFQMILPCEIDYFLGTDNRFISLCEILRSELDLGLEIFVHPDGSLGRHTLVQLSSRVCGRSSCTCGSHSLSCSAYFRSSGENKVLFLNRPPDLSFDQFQAIVYEFDLDKDWNSIIRGSKFVHLSSLLNCLLEKSVMIVFQIQKLKSSVFLPTQQQTPFLRNDTFPSKEILRNCIFDSMRKLLEEKISHFTFDIETQAHQSESVENASTTTDRREVCF